jgi:hypothetical protein
MRGMTKNILEWGWHTSTPNSSSSSDTEWKLATTMIGGDAEPNIDIAAAGDLKCLGICASGGDYGTTAAYRVGNTPLCRKCAVKRLGVEDEPGGEQNKTLKNFEIPGR